MEGAGGENSEHEIGITLVPAAEQTDDTKELPSPLKDGMSQDIFLARAIARTQNMGK